MVDPAVETFSWKSRSGSSVTAGRIASLVAVYRGQLEARLKGQKKLRSTVNSAIRESLEAAGEMWIKVFLPKRFEPEYARGVLGYHATKDYEADKVKYSESRDAYSFTEERGFALERERVMVAAPQPTPFVLTGNSRTGVLSGAYVEARVTATKWVLKIHVNPGSISFTKQYNNFMKIPMIEYARVSVEVEKQLKMRLGLSTPETLPERKTSNG